MTNLFTIWRRELAACFLSPIAYVIMVVFFGASGFTFFLGAVRNVGASDPLTSLLVGAVVIWLGLLIPVITMRLFAEEKRSGTIETLMTAPVTESQVVLGKYAGAFSFLVLVTLPVLVSVFILERFSPGLAFEDIDLGAMLGGFTILLLLLAFFTAAGLLISLMTRNQVVSAVCGGVVFWLCLLFGWLLSILPGGGGGATDYVSATTHIEDFCRGIMDARTILLYVSGTWLLLFSSVRVLESRQLR